MNPLVSEYLHYSSSAFISEHLHPRLVQHQQNPAPSREKVDQVSGMNVAVVPEWLLP